ncbi:hypothetical protein AHF37_04463 [Paragonimus kellicotti]|nr:hypothetical protein AHF37_04463 [Paragonimus kellicotti]
MLKRSCLLEFPQSSLLLGVKNSLGSSSNDMVAAGGSEVMHFFDDAPKRSHALLFSRQRIPWNRPCSILQCTKQKYSLVYSSKSFKIERHPCPIVFFVFGITFTAVSFQMQETFVKIQQFRLTLSGRNFES